MKGYLYSDGASRSNPGKAATGCLLFDENWKVVSFDGKYYPHLTNNQAEYMALELGLKLAEKNGFDDLTCFLDSELVVRQLNGQYKVKDEKIVPLKKQIITLSENFAKISFNHVPREKNRLADRLVNVILDAIEQK